MRFGGDTYFNKWVVPLIPINKLSVMKMEEHVKLWEKLCLRCE